MAAAYREGRALSYGDVVALALTLLDDVAASRPLTRPNFASQTPSAPEPVQQTQSTGENPLTEREQEVLRLVAQGLASKEIGPRLYISTSTVKYHLKAIFKKLGVETRAQAIAVASQRGLL
jgi:DNA-binding NarL/FixJ family response regulator